MRSHGFLNAYIRHVGHYLVNGGVVWSVGKMNRNRHIKISVTLPIHLLEKLDKRTTYKGKSRSKYVAKAIQDRIDTRIPVGDIDNMQLMSMLEARTDDIQLKIMLRLALGWEIGDLTKGLPDNGNAKND